MNKVVCIRRGNWFREDTGNEVSFGPKYQDIVTVEKNEGEFFHLVEYPSYDNKKCRFRAEYFRPVDFDFGEKVCEEITKICETETVEA